MLKSLLIQNFVLIDSLNIRFNDGFSVITGETGAGKSIILGALGLVLGQRADTKSIQTNAEKCVVEAVFNISAYNLELFFEENDLEYDAENCILRREILNSGKSRAFVNDTPAPLSIIRMLGNRLIDVHSQHQNLLLADSDYQLNVVDIIAQASPLLKKYKEEYYNYQTLTKQFNTLQEKVSRAKNDQEYIRFQYEELKAIKPMVGEQSELEQELETLSHIEEIKSALYKITELLKGDEKGATQFVKESLSTIKTLEKFYAKSVEFAERLETTYIELKDMATEIDALKEDIDFNPERMEWVNNRLNTLYTLQQKHHVNSADDLVRCLQEFEKQLHQIESFDEEMKAIIGKQKIAYDLLEKKSAEISTLRKNAAKTIEKEIIQRMVMLGIPNTQFRIDFISKAEPGANGKDEINFMFTANKNEPLKPVAQTASGGEISRFMLCIKAMIAGYAALPTIIFDEIDTGTSGEIADKMAGIMQDLGNKMQVITITHLPQIAAKGNEQYFVYKEDTKERTYTRIRQLDPQERINEIARMLSGSSLTGAALANAKELLKNRI